jgi:hypothetical protein
MNGGESAYARQRLASDGTAWRIISARVLTPETRLKPYAFAKASTPGMETLSFSFSFSFSFCKAFVNASMASRNVFLCPPNAAANVAFQLRTSRTTPCVPSEVNGTRPALVPSRENVAAPESSPPIESVSPADAKSVRTCPPSYDLYTYGVIPKYFAGGGVHPTKSTTSCSLSRHSHEKEAPFEASGNTRAVWRNRSSSASLGFASPSAGVSSDSAASRVSRTNARAPMSVENTEGVLCRVDDDASVVRGVAEEEDWSGTKEPPRVSDVPVSSETFRAAPNEDDTRGLLADDTGVPPSSSASAETRGRAGLA